MSAIATSLPHVCHTIAEMRATLGSLRAAGKTVGLVPTMGALHEGHLSLVRQAKRECDVAIATIFVNPTQFGPQEDFQKYPRTLARDLELLAQAACEFVFAPEAAEMYPPGAGTFVEPPKIADVLEGVCRPGHFRGVATIVLKLFNIIPADVAYFGQKDFQQALLIRHLAADLNVPVRIKVCPIVREADGLALSSRNRYLSPAERTTALAISRSLAQAQALVASNERDAAAIKARMLEVLARGGIERVEYVALADPETLVERARLDAPTVALVAAWVGTTRLIDNQLLSPPPANP